MTGITYIDNILLYSLILFIPFFFVGVFLAEVFHTFPALSSRIYGADLPGAAAGSMTGYVSGSGRSEGPCMEL